MSKKVRKVIAWGGFVDNKLDFIDADTGWGGFATGDITWMPAVFKTRTAARAKYQDVRRVEIAAPPPQRMEG